MKIDEKQGISSSPYSMFIRST